MLVVVFTAFEINFTLQINCFEFNLTQCLLKILIHNPHNQIPAIQKTNKIE